jgi:hypothetical protein
VKPTDMGCAGRVVVKRLHRMVRHGFRPWLGYSAASREDEAIHLRRHRRAGGLRYLDIAQISPDGSVWFVHKVPLARPLVDSEGNTYTESYGILADDSENFDALFPPDRVPPERGRFIRQLYEWGF